MGFYSEDKQKASATTREPIPPISSWCTMARKKRDHFPRLKSHPVHPDDQKEGKQQLWHAHLRQLLAYDPRFVNRCKTRSKHQLLEKQREDKHFVVKDKKLLGNLERQIINITCRMNKSIKGKFRKKNCKWISCFFSYFVGDLWIEFWCFNGCSITNN